MDAAPRFTEGSRPNLQRAKAGQAPPLQESQDNIPQSYRNVETLRRHPDGMMAAEYVSVIFSNSLDLDEENDGETEGAGDAAAVSCRAGDLERGVRRGVLGQAGVHSKR